MNIGCTLVINDVVQSSYGRSSCHLSWEFVYNGLYLLGYVEWWDLFLTLQSLWSLACNWASHPGVKLFSFPSTFGEKFTELAGNFVFNYISPTPYSNQVERLALASCWGSLSLWKERRYNLRPQIRWVFHIKDETAGPKRKLPMLRPISPNCDLG